ncbi:hypothetical protein LKI01_01760 [Companilactobacillus paralimentarius]|nr:hypothetical protein LKI01_01760 [Companilactobacillus paralimentarius]
MGWINESGNSNYTIIPYYLYDKLNRRQVPVTCFLHDRKL